MLRIPVSALSVARPVADVAEGQKALSLPADVLAQFDEPLLTHLIDSLTYQLHQQAATLSNEQVSTRMRLISRLDEQREEAELAANPARRAGIERAAQTFASRTK